MKGIGKIENLLFCLLQNVVGNRTVSERDFISLSEGEWFALYRVATIQGVTAITYDALQPILNHMPRRLKLQWALSAEGISSRYLKQESLSKELVALYESNGINTVGSGIGHDLLLMLDDDPQQTYVLNDYFMAQNNSYQQGLVSYKMPEMTEGLHSLTFRAWDLLNNSNTSKLNFQVVKGLDPQIYQALAYPNPVSATGVLNFHIEYDQPDEVIQTEIYLYCMNGQLVKMHTQKGADGIQWNMSSMNVSPGIYIYQVKIKTPTSDYVSRAGKIIVSH